jgi:hypothetical protein
MPKAEDITRLYEGTIKIGKKVIQLTESAHKAILVSLMNLTCSAITNGDAGQAGEMILEFLSDVKKADLPNYEFQFTDQVKEVTIDGLTLHQLASLFNAESVSIDWKVSRGGKRSIKKETVKLGSL